MLNMFRTLIYPSSGACDFAVELPHRSFCSRFVVCWRFGAGGFGLALAYKTAVARWLRCCATNRKVAGSIPDGVIGIFR